MSFSTDFDKRRYATIKREHRCQQYKSTYRYIQNLRHHEIVCHYKPTCDKITKNCCVSLSRIDHKNIDLKSECNKYMQINIIPKVKKTNKQTIEFHSYLSVRRSERRCKIKSKIS